MAIQFKEVDDKLRKTPLTNEELVIINNVEDYIDKKIKKYYRGDCVYIELCYPNFTYDPIKLRNMNYPEVRRIMMQQELQRRYEVAGWKVTTKFDDGLDGPNRSGPDYWILTGKNK